MIELIVGMVALLALIAGLLQLASLTRAQTDAMVEARREAGELALLDVGSGDILSDPEFIEDWEEGPDGKRYTRDDRPITASVSPFDNTIVERAAPDAFGWELLHRVPDDELPGLQDHPDPVSHFGLVKGDHSETVNLIPAVRSLFYRADRIDVECDVWMTHTKGIY